MYDEPNNAGWEATLAHIAHMKETMESRGGRFMVVLLPLLIQLDSYPFTDLSMTISRALERREVDFFDTTPAFRGRREEELWVHPADRHPNESAHAIIAGELLHVLESSYF